MLNIELLSYGVDDIMKQIVEDLRVALSSNSKRQKDAMIAKTLGAINAIQNMIIIMEVDNDTTAE